jgi:hypothetical protein
MPINYNVFPLKGQFPGKKTKLSFVGNYNLNLVTTFQFKISELCNNTESKKSVELVCANYLVVIEKYINNR